MASLDSGLSIKNAKYAFAQCGVATYYDQKLEIGTLDLTMSECDLIDGDCEPSTKRARLIVILLHEYGKDEKYE